LNQVPDVTVKAAWDPRLGPYKLHVEAWGLYRQFFDRFNFANHTYDTGSFGGHISAEVIPQTLELQVYGAHGALGRFTASPYQSLRWPSQIFSSRSWQATMVMVLAPGASGHGSATAMSSTPSMPPSRRRCVRRG